MAEVIGLVASIVALVETSARLTLRLSEFISKTTDVPESLRSLAARLPLLKQAVDGIRVQAKSGTLIGDVEKALHILIDDILNQTTLVQKALSKLLPQDGDSKWDRGLKVLKSLAKEPDLQQAVEKIHKGIDILTLYQTTSHIATSDLILRELSKLTAKHDSPLYALGLCLGQAPSIEPEAFVGRRRELEDLHSWLSPLKHPRRRSIVSIVGMGGMGKTQLSLAYAREFADDFSAVFWLDAKDESSLRQGMAGLDAIIFDATAPVNSLTTKFEQPDFKRVQRWLSEPGNDGWLLIMDNYDDPSLPGLRSPTGYDIRSFFPARSQGSILITSRSTRLTFSKVLRLQIVEDEDSCIDILSQRSGRDFTTDNEAKRLVKRLGGLPLALATTGTYLGRTGCSCAKYLNLYDSVWKDLVGTDTSELLEYEARTMSSTWTLSLDQVRGQDRNAAELLKFFAYFHYGEIWYELIRAGRKSSDNKQYHEVDLPWLRHVTESEIEFNRAMSKLQDYSLVTVVADSYQIHPCLHDWILDTFPPVVESPLFATALECIKGDMGNVTEYWKRGVRLSIHLTHLQSPRFDTHWSSYSFNEETVETICELVEIQWYLDVDKDVEHILSKCLTRCESIYGPDHIATLKICRSLSHILPARDRVGEAEQLIRRVIAGAGKDDAPTESLQQCIDLADLQCTQARPEDAEDTLKSSLQRTKVQNDFEHLTLWRVRGRIGFLYYEQSKWEAAARSCLQLLEEEKRSNTPENSSTFIFRVVTGLAHYNQQDLISAEYMFRRAVAGFERLGVLKSSELMFAVRTLHGFYYDIGRDADAEDVLKRFNITDPAELDSD